MDIKTKNGERFIYYRINVRAIRGKTDYDTYKDLAIVALPMNLDLPI